MLTEQQKRDRLKYVTGSDCSVICGVNPWMTEIDLYRIKRGEIQEEDKSHLPFVIAGSYLEPGVAKMFENETGLMTYSKDGMIISDKHYWMSGNIDRFISNKNEILEIKTTRSRRNSGWGELGDDTINEIALLQGAHYCAVTETDACYFGVFFRAEGEFQVYRYERNARLEGILIEKERVFWEEHVLRGIPPAARSLNEVRSLRSNLVINGAKVATPEISEILSKYKELKEHSSAVEERMQNLRKQLCLAIGDNETIEDDMGKCLATWKYVKGNRRFDADRFKEECPDMHRKYVVDGNPYRRLLIK